MKARWIVAAVLALALLMSCAGHAEPAAKTGAALIPSLRTVIDGGDFSDYDFTEKALEYITVIGERFPNRCVAGEGADNRHDDFADWLVAELEAGGYDPSQIEQQRFSGESMFGDTVEGRNIILTVPGQETGQIIVGAHYDGDGVGDNGSGTALLLATALGLVDTKPRFTIRYVFFDAEEVGKVGSRFYAEQMTADELASTIYMINVDAIVFGDFCNLYGGVYGDDYDSDYIAIVEGEPLPEPEQTEAYAFAADIAESLGFKVYRPADLDGYYEANGEGMPVEDGAFFTNPWTNAHPAPQSFVAPSPASIGASDHAPFAARGIPYIYFEATNWWAAGSDASSAYTGYVETYDASLGDGGQFMNTEYDTLENMQTLFPGRAEQHFHQYSPLLSALLLATD